MEEVADSSLAIVKKKKSKKEGRLRREAEDYMENIARRGVIYLSRVPPFMKPNKARSIFEQYGEVTRLYLAEEDILLRKKRKENGGNGSKQFNEGLNIMSVILHRDLIALSFPLQAGSSTRTRRLRGRWRSL